MDQRTPALIFDFGNVVAFFDYRRACEHFGARVGLTGDALLERVKSLGFTPLVQRYESGKMSAEEFSREMCALAGIEMAHPEFASTWGDIFWLNEPVAELITHLKREGYSLVLGSNTNDIHAAQFRQQFAATLAHFDHLILSYEVGHLKPSANFYKACVAATGLPANSCVFIDDLPENVEGARAAGLKGIVYRDDPSLIAELQKLGVHTPLPSA